MSYSRIFLTWCVLFISTLAALASPTEVQPWTGAAAVSKRTADVSQNNRFDGFDVEKNSIKFDFESDFPMRNVDFSGTGSIPDNSFPSYSLNVGSPQSLGVSFTGATLADTRAFPPDTMGAVGPTQFIVAVNGRIRSFNKTTGIADGVLNADTDVFFNSVMTPPASNNFTSDPRIRYDRLSGRWFIIIIDVPGQTGSLPNRVMIAVSDTSVITPTTVWSFFYFQHDLVSPAGDTGLFADYPTLGIDANALYIGVNVFGTRTFSGTTGFVVRKSSILGAGPIVVTAFRNLISKSKGVSTGPYTPQGVDNYDPNATEGYFIGVDTSYNNRIQLRRVSDPAGSPTISGNITITVPTMAAPQTVPHLGNTGGNNGNLDGLDTRLIAAHIRNGRLWTCQNLGVNNTGVAGTTTRNGVRWYEFQGIPTGQTPSVFQSGTVYQPSPSNSTDQRNYWMGSIMVSGQGHAAMGFSTAGVNEYINAGTCGRLSTDPLGTMQTPTLYTASSTAYNPASDTGGSSGRRWGDYSYTCLDPNDDMTMWTIQEFCDATDSYGVRAVRLLAPPPATPTNCSPNALVAGVANVNVAVSGLAVNGSGFYDPGTGFSNRIAAAVNGGGVTVNSVTYTDPLHITLNLSVSAAAVSGTRTITVTNPDGQSITSGALITVNGSSNNAPVLAAISNATLSEGTTLTFTASASDPDAGQTLSYSLDSGAPAGATINPSTGAFSWTPTEAQGPSTNSITVRVTDSGVPALSDTKTFTVVVNEVNTAPTLAAISNRSVNEGTTLSITNLATDTDLPANVLSFSLSNAPSGMTINSSSGVISWNPTEAQGPAVYSITVVVTDSGSPQLSDSKTFSITVNEVNASPVLAAIASQNVNEGTALTITNSATDADVPANSITFSLGTNAPAGLTIDPATGVLTWTPTEAQGPGVYSVTVKASDNGSPALSDSKTFSITVNEVNAAPTLVTTVTRTIHAGATLVVTNVALDSDLPTNSLSFSLTNAPAGMTIDSSSGVLTWTPDDSFAGTTNSFGIVVADDGSPSLSDTKSGTVIVVARPVFQPATISSNTVTLSWTAIASATYQVQFKNDLTDAVWSNLNNGISFNNGFATTTDTATAVTRFYRVIAE